MLMQPSMNPNKFTRSSIAPSSGWKIFSPFNWQMNATKDKDEEIDLGLVPPKGNDDKGDDLDDTGNNGSSGNHGGHGSGGGGGDGEEPSDNYKPPDLGDMITLGYIQHETKKEYSAVYRAKNQGQKVDPLSRKNLKRPGMKKD